MHIDIIFLLPFVMNFLRLRLLTNHLCKYKNFIQSIIAIVASFSWFYIKTFIFANFLFVEIAVR